MKEQGQVTIFFAVALIMIITMIAFVINVGLFVKAKINLQNAVDAAAWAGAATQARQITDIAYLNWEMRNIYKEWMFKYYVLGNLSAPGVKNPGSKGNNNNVGRGQGMDFTIGPSSSKDVYNVPSICIHNRAVDNDNDVCSAYTIPGLPRLATPGFSSLDETTSIIIDVLSGRKSLNCSQRSQANFSLAMAWVFGTGVEDNTKKLLRDSEIVAADRPGAWVQAMELAIRIRNLEYMVNAAPHTEGICKNSGTKECGVLVDELADGLSPANERSIKAFYSAYRNLGNETDRELKDSFVLTEISPKPFRDGSENSLSNLLIPATQAGSLNKYYLDLRLYLVNYAYFYSMLATQSVATNDTDNNYGTGIEGECQMIKVAIPVPGYPMGFDKNPDVMTYYAVKGEADFVGLFNPFNKAIKLTAYAAAKPFGGRIGPRNFEISQDQKYVKVRNDSQRFRSSPYLFGLQLGPELTQIQGPGNAETSKKNIPALIPNNNNFWVSSEDDAIGGTQDLGDLKFAVPNLLYDPDNLGNVYTSSALFSYHLPIKPNNEILDKGLYDIDQFKKFLNSNLEVKPQLSADDIKKAIYNVHSPTHYEQLNYLIPTTHLVNTMVQTDSFGIPTTDGIAKIYAPLYDEKLLYKNAKDVNLQIQNYLTLQKPSIEKYVDTLNNIAKTFRQMRTESATTDTAKEIYLNAANIIHDNVASNNQLSCKSIAGKFYYFFLGAESGMSGTNLANCPNPLADELDQLYTAALQGTQPDARLDKNYHHFPLGFKENSQQLRNNFTAYDPGPLTGGTVHGGPIKNLFAEDESLSLRNFYSTKFISLNSLVLGSDNSYWNSRVPMYFEGIALPSNNPKGQGNYLMLQDVTTGQNSEIFQ